MYVEGTANPILERPSVQGAPWIEKNEIVLGKIMKKMVMLLSHGRNVFGAMLIADKR